MEFENPQIPEGINVAKRNHLVDFLVLTAGAIVVILIITYILSLFSGYIAKKIPFETELSFTEPFESHQNKTLTGKQKYLSDLVSKIADCSDLPEEIIIKYNYQDNDMVNAFATLGGNIIIFEGLIDELDNENELAMIIAHEIAHIKHRHPIQSFGRAVILNIAFSLIIGNAATNPIENTGLLTLLKFSREMELEADEDGLNTLNNCYGHINGASQVFEKFEKIQQKHNQTPTPLFSTHPMNSDRISRINEIANENNWKLTGKLIQLPN